MACGLGLGMRLVQLPKLHQCLYDTQIHRNWHTYDYTQSGRQSYVRTLSLLCPILASASYLTFPEASSWRGTTADEDPAAPWRNDWTYSSMYCWTGNSVTSWADELKWLLKRGVAKFSGVTLTWKYAHLKCNWTSPTDGYQQCLPCHTSAYANGSCSLLVSPLTQYLWHNHISFIPRPSV